MRSTGIVLSLLALLAAGCLNTHNGEPVRPGQKPVVLTQQRIVGLNAPTPDHWQRVFVGELPRPKLEGYMRSRVVVRDDVQLLLHWVYDDRFQLVGVMTDLGKTTRYDRHGEPHYLGILEVNEGLLAVLDHGTSPKAPKVTLVDMPAPAE